MNAVKNSVPNLISLLRLALIYPIYLFFPSQPLIALLIFALAALTDFFDGWVARKLNAQSNFGAKLDPLIDKIFYFAMLWILFDTIPFAFWIFVFTLPSEVMLTAIRFWPFKNLFNATVPATDIGKEKMVLQMGAIAIMMLGLLINYYPMVLEGIIVGTVSIFWSWAS